MAMLRILQSADSCSAAVPRAEHKLFGRVTCLHCQRRTRDLFRQEGCPDVVILIRGPVDLSTPPTQLQLDGYTVR